MSTIPQTLPADVSTYHRGLWNQVAADIGVDVRWNQDGAQAHTISSYADMEISPEDRAKYGLDGVPFEKALALRRDLDRVAAKLESRRVDALRQSLDVNAVYVTRPDLSHLTAPERELIHRLLAAVPVLKDLDILLKDRRGLEFRDYLDRTQDALGQEQFRRVSHNAGARALPEGVRQYASPVDYFPNPAPTYGTTMPTALIPEGLTDQAFEESVAVMARAYPDPMYNPYLSPFTVVSPDKAEPSGWAWKKICDDPDFKPLIEELSDIVIRAAQIPGLDRNLKAHLLQATASWLSGDPFSHYAEDEAWVRAVTGNLEVTIGPGGGYSPMGKAGGAALFIAVERPGEADFMKANLVPVMPELEKRLAELIGGGVYKARDIPPDGSVRVVDVIVSTGSAFNVTLAFVGPDEGPVARRGRVKRIIGANHHEAKAEKILLPIAEIALDPALMPYVSKEHFVMDSTAHEMMHAIGPRSDIIVAGGLKTRDAIGGAVFDSIEESKANVGGLTALAYLRDHGGAVDPAYVRATYATYVAGLMRQMRFGRHAHGGGAWSEMGFLFQEGAVALAEVAVGAGKERRLTIDFAAMDRALEKLWVRIAKIQATGDKEGARVLIQDIPLKVPEELGELFAKIASAGIPVDVVMDYPEVTQPQ